MFTSFLIFILCILACVFIPKESEALPLYYDAESDTQSTTSPVTEVEATTVESSQSDLPTSKDSKKMKVYVGGSVINDTPTKQPQPASGVEESIDDLRSAAKNADPNTTRAQDMFDEITRNGL